MSIALDFRLTQGRFTLDCSLASAERVVGLFGPSGAGKSSILRVLAGLARPETGRVVIGDRVVFDAERGINVPAHKRRIGFVFQQARLFPHFNVRHNLAYGGWFARHRPDARRFDQVVEMLDIGPLLGRRVAALSGGEAQRVAIGRALLSDPAMLLLDEPLASLDASRKQEVLPYIARLSAESELPIVFVSHQLDELLRLANRHVAVVQGGRVVFSGATADFLSRPSLLGAEGHKDTGVLLKAHVHAHDVDDGLSVLACPQQRLYVPHLPGYAPGAEVTVHVRARDVILARAEPGVTSALNDLRGIVVHIAEDAPAHAVDVILDIDGQRLDARITRKSAAALALRPGDGVHAIIKSLALAEQAWQRLGGL
ncbi:molybdenum ABC transporter ATP-binding protein [Salinisphaera sp. Q1T1-3]|uniref:molybdenum ABC transporter ATP-binding protein n=1 Tax=Salinisphaera sp. Q1T1-3 TaxID=2321229 RepID=UPI000E72FA61|nr:molybdenum ABC transporter ATP-binding protein [Salinisphaera sp. Q1T1-3]RJS94798.1 molybdenum ABC transporter ATP-binding protein [Salinisphaera sp. Q1T1-3]